MYVPRLKCLKLDRVQSLLVLLASTMIILVFSGRWLVQSSLAQEPDTVSGFIFRDYNASGSREALEPGVGGITVTAYDAGGQPVAATATDLTGTYSLNIAAGSRVRIEVTQLPGYLQPGAAGPDSRTTVTFVTSPATGVNVGVNNPGQYCSAMGLLATTCFVVGDQSLSTAPIAISVPETAGSSSDTDEAAYDTPPYTIESRADQTGTAWGLAYRSKSGILYIGSFVRRHAGLGSTLNPTTIYAAEQGSGTASPWLTVDPSRPDPHAATTDWPQDFDTFDKVFKEGLGDLELSEDEDTLYTVDLGMQELVAISITSDGTPGNVTRIPILPDGIDDCTDNDGTVVPDDVRPFGLGINDGSVYIGVVCSAQSTVLAGTLPITGWINAQSVINRPGNKSKLRGYVYRWEGGASFTQVLNFPLNYERGCTNRNGQPGCLLGLDAMWNPWVDIYPFYDNQGQHDGAYTQPLITDIDFDNGHMIIGLADRWGHQTAPITLTPPHPQNANGGPGHLIDTFNEGDILRACRAGPDSWVMEEMISGDASCATPGVSSNVGDTLLIDEYYYEDNYAPPHAEITGGGLVQIPGRPQVVSNGIDPVRPIPGQLYDAGLIWYDNLEGNWAKAFRVYNDTGPIFGPTLGKAAGLGDVEAICPPAPIEIGNYVWFDTNKDGVQGADESPIAGVIVHLYDAAGARLASATTDDNGNYLFNDGNVPGGLNFNIAYFVALEPAQFDAEGTLVVNSTLYGPVTTENTGTGDSPDINDSDGIIGGSGLPVIDDGGAPYLALTTGNAGFNNHTYDFGFTPRELPTETPTATLSPAATDTPTETPTGTQTPTTTPAPTETPGAMPSVTPPPPDDDDESEEPTPGSPNGPPPTPVPLPSITASPAANLFGVAFLPETGQPATRELKFILGYLSVLLLIGGGGLWACRGRR